MNNTTRKPSLNLRFHLVALIIVAVGAAIGITASMVTLGTHGEFATTTFVTSIIALVAAYPVFRDYRRLHRAVFTRFDS